MRTFKSSILLLSVIFSFTVFAENRFEGTAINSSVAVDRDSVRDFLIYLLIANLVPVHIALEIFFNF